MTLTGATAARSTRRAADPGLAGARVEALDVRDDAAVRALVAALGPLDVVVNCAGVIRRGAEHDPAAFAEVLDINLTGTMRVLQRGTRKLWQAAAAASSTRRRC